LAPWAIGGEDAAPGFPADCVLGEAFAVGAFGEDAGGCGGVGETMPPNVLTCATVGVSATAVPAAKKPKIKIINIFMTHPFLS